MQVVQHLGDLATQKRPCHVAIGMFDGVHLGHRALLDRTRETAHADDGLVIAVTFDRHPNTILAPDQAPPLIQHLPARLATLGQLDLDATVTLPFDEAFSRVNAEEFIASLARHLAPLRSISVGAGFTFGHRRQGDTALLQSLGHHLGYVTHILAPVCLDRVPIRSTRIRQAIAEGRLAAAGQMLGRPYSIASQVIRGEQRGRQLGFPTANLDIAGLALPPPGVYVAEAEWKQARYPAVLNLGFRPTVDPDLRRQSLEVHLLDFNDDLYSESLEVRLSHHLRSEMRFGSLPQLQAQIAQDIALTRAWIARSVEASALSPDA